mmetsp:Transcript_23064/g.64475  ORF Transcript_23064/g.64475 Transcript_23064/m.64475 type:complete len:239 (-) Transcript_23064:1194-1910(-)
MLDAGGDFLLPYPGLKMVLALLFVLPLEDNLAEAFVFVWNRVLGERFNERGIRQIADQVHAEPLLFLLLRELVIIILLFLLFFLLFFFLLLFRLLRIFFLISFSILLFIALLVPILHLLVLLFHLVFYFVLGLALGLGTVACLAGSILRLSRGVTFLFDAFLIDLHLVPLGLGLLLFPLHRRFFPPALSAGGRPLLLQQLRVERGLELVRRLAKHDTRHTAEMLLAESAEELLPLALD